MTTTTAQFRYIGTTDETTTCDCCGKAKLRNTIIIMPLDADGSDDGEPCYYGSTCAAKALAVRGGGKAVRQAADGARLKTLMNAHDAARMLLTYGLPFTGEPTIDAFETAVGRYAEQHDRAAWAAYTTRSEWKHMTGDMITRKQAAIAEAVLVAGERWKDDPQPVEYYGRKTIESYWKGF